MIPQSKQNAIKIALESTFGTSDYLCIKRLTKGLSNALVFCIEVLGKPYLLKIARTDALADPTLYYYTCMQSASQVGIVPRIWYTNVEDQISISDFIDTKPLSITEAKNLLGEVLCKLHSIPPFSKSIHSLDTTNRFVSQLQVSKILPEYLIEELFQLYGKIADVYPRNPEDMVASHNDLKPENILFDGNLIWLTDWEAAFTNDRYSDLAIVANFLVNNESDELDFLNSYFKRRATEYELAKYYLMQQIIHMSYFTVFLSIVAAKGKPIDLCQITKHNFRDFHNRMWAGEIDLGFDKPRLEYALIHMEKLLDNMHNLRFNHSLNILSEAI